MQDLTAQHVDQILHKTTVSGSSIMQPMEGKQAEKTDQCRDVLTSQLNGDVVVGLGGVQGGEHLESSQAVHDIPDARCWE